MLSSHPTLPAAQASAPGIQAMAEAGTNSPALPDSQAPGAFASILKKQVDGNAAGTDGAANTSAASLPGVPVDTAIDDGLAALVAALMSPGQKPLSPASLARPQHDAALREASSRAASAEKTRPDTLPAAPGGFSARESQEAILQANTTPLAAPAGMQTQGHTGEQTATGGQKKPAPEEQPATPTTDPALAALLAMFPPPRPGNAPEQANTAEEAAGRKPAAAKETLSTISTLRAEPDGKKALDQEAALPRANTPSRTADFSATAASSASASVPTSADETGNAPSFHEILNASQISAGASQSLHAASDVRLATHAAATPQARIDTPLNHPGWDHELGDKLVWAVGRQEQKAELIITPPQLGRVEVSLHQQGEQTTVVFTAASPAVREALENALPRLREMFSDAGLSLGQASVGADSGQQNFRQSSGNPENRDNSPSYSQGERQDSEGNMSRLMEKPAWMRQGRGMVDVFA